MDHGIDDASSEASPPAPTAAASCEVDPAKVTLFENDLIVFRSLRSDPTDVRNRLGRVVEVSRDKLRIQVRSIHDDSNPVTMTGPVEVYDPGDVTYSPITDFIVDGHSDKVKKFFGAPGLKFRGKPYFFGMRHSVFGTFCRGNLVTSEREVTILEPGTQDLETSIKKARRLIIAGFTVTGSRPNLKVIMCDANYLPDFMSANSKGSFIVPPDALEVVGMSDGG